MLKCLMNACINNTEISKICKAHWNIVTRLIKENELANVLEEYDDNVIIVNALKWVLDCCKNLGELHARDTLCSKETKVKQKRFAQQYEDG